ncbi:MAG: (d)CMP kinase [Bacteroidota bacterium]
MKPIKIAIDGFAGGGKSTTAKRVAQKLSYTYIDTGAMYRAVTLYFLRNGIDFQEETERLRSSLTDIHIEFGLCGDDPIPQIRLNGEWVEPAIRSREVSDAVSPVAVHASVRHALVAQQQRMGAQGGVVMDGRDIGTVVFPDAELKIFIHADLKVRAIRRQQEMEARGQFLPLEDIISNLKKRDRIDSTRAIAPLKKAQDAIELDTTNMTIEQQVEEVCRLARETLQAPLT